MGPINRISTKFRKTLKVRFISPGEECELCAPLKSSSSPAALGYNVAKGICGGLIHSRGRYKFIRMTKWGPISRSLTRDLTESRRESFHLHVYGGSGIYRPTKVCGDHPGKEQAGGTRGGDRGAFIIV